MSGLSHSKVNLRNQVCTDSKYILSLIVFILLICTLMHIFILYTNFLKEYFIELSAERLYFRDQQADQIAMIAIYIPIIQAELVIYTKI